MEEIVGLESSREGNIAIASFKSACISDVEEISCASKMIKEFVEQNKPNRLIFDFEMVKFFSSQVLGLILDVRAKVKAFDGEVVISAINPQLHRVFRITNLDKIFRFFPDRQSATGSTAAD
jgi:anti-sigma B factor antagonist